MNDNTNITMPICPACGKGSLHPATETRVFMPNGQRVEVELLTSVCDACGADAIRPAQHRENLERLKARKTHYGKLLMGEEILALRKRYGLTQQQASKIFGKGKIAFSRYESETTYPDESTTLLLKLALERPDSLKWLADQAGVDLPLWKERCEDDQRVKVRALTVLPFLEKSSQRLAGERITAQPACNWWKALTPPTMIALETCNSDWAANEEAA